MPDIAWIDGEWMALSEARIPVTDPGFTHGWSVFETMDLPSHRGDTFDERVHMHLSRLRQSCHSAAIPAPDDSALVALLHELVGRSGLPATVRITLTGAGRTVLTATCPTLGRKGSAVRVRTAPWVSLGFGTGRTKHGSRGPWRAAVEHSGLDDILFVDESGHFLEGTTCGIFAVVAGEVWTPPWDGRILESTTIRRMLAACQRLGVATRRESVSAEGPYDALYIANATRTVAPVVEIDQRPLPGWDPVGRRLAKELGVEARCIA